MGNELNEYLQTSLNLNDSLIFLMIVIMLTLTAIYIFRVYMFILGVIKYPKRGFNIKNIGLTVLFAELTPDLMIRIVEEKQYYIQIKNNNNDLNT